VVFSGIKRRIEAEQAAFGQTRNPIIDLFPLIIFTLFHIYYVRILGSMPIAQVAGFYLAMAFICTLFYKRQDQPAWKEFFMYLAFAVAAIIWLMFMAWFQTVFPFIMTISIGKFTIGNLITDQLKYFPLFGLLAFNYAPTWARIIVKWYLTLWVIGLSLVYIYAMIKEMPFAQATVPIVETGTPLWKNTFEGFGAIMGDWVRQSVMGWKTFQNQTINRVTDPYFYGAVEKSKTDRELGVYLKNGRPLQDIILPEDQEIIVDADIIAKSFTEEINIENTCYARYHRLENDKPLKTWTNLIGHVEPPTLSIHDYEENQLTCTINRQAMETKDTSITVVMNATFEFQTWGYMDYAFMDRDELYQRQKSGTADVARELGLKSSTVEAVYTNGPITLGMVRESAPPKLPYGLDSTKPVLPLFGVTIQNQQIYANRGHIIEIKKLVFHVPDPIKLDKESCAPEKNPVETRDEQNGYTLYTFNNVQVRSEADYQSQRCRLVIEPSQVEKFLGEGGIALATFAVEADYKYAIFEDVKIPLEQPRRATS
jgi:hypothetical protein